MIKKTIMCIITCVIVCMFSFYMPQRSLAQNTNDDLLLDFIRETFPSAVVYEEPKTSDDWIVIYDPEQKIIGYATITSPYTDDILGHVGPISLLICIDTRERIESVKLLQHFETIGLMEILAENGFLDTWNGEAWDRAIEREVDAISGATVSTQAIIDSVKKRLGMMKAPKK
ncbi:MAG: FMN-binding protein [Candidatus Omnitrophica bacterium]|nr:FMN-binding protein [Candidatus Omnitrophota bacterium]